MELQGVIEKNVGLQDMTEMDVDNMTDIRRRIGYPKFIFSTFNVMMTGCMFKLLVWGHINRIFIGCCICLMIYNPTRVEENGLMVKISYMVVNRSCLGSL